MRTARVLGFPGTYYHVISRVVDRRMIFDRDGKEILRKMLRKVTDFSGVRVVTYAMLDNHFHLLVQVPRREVLTDEELLRRIGVLYGETVAKSIGDSLRDMQQKGAEQAARDLREKYLYRMYDLSEFMKTLKQRMSVWYNRNTGRKGTLWEDRFKSVLVEGKQGALATVAAYIDLNAVRAGIVKDPKDYRWSGYGEAMGGGCSARIGLGMIMQSLGGDAQWSAVSGEYRKYLYQKGEERGVSPNGRPIRSGFKREEVKAVLAAGGQLPLVDLLHCRVRYFSDGMALGSREYVNGIFKRYRHKFGPDRKEGARKLRHGEWGDLFGLRDLQVDVISVSGT